MKDFCNDCGAWGTEPNITHHQKCPKYVNPNKPLLDRLEELYEQGEKMLKKLDELEKNLLASK